jgi:hypothetical protein
MLRRIAFLWLVAFVVAACGDGNEEGALGVGDRGLDRCSLLTVEEVERWIGPLESEPAPSDSLGEPDLVTCYYKAADSPNSILVQAYDGEVFFAERGSQSRTGPDVSGLGEDAWRDQDSVKFLQNEWSVSVSKILGGFDDEALLDLAQLVSPRLP